MSDQLAPIATDAVPTWDLVIQDIVTYHGDRPHADLVIADANARDGIGRERYGVPLQAGNGRDSLMDAYEEVLDYAAYMKSAFLEEESRIEVSGEFLGRWLYFVLAHQYSEALRKCIEVRGILARRDGR